MIDHLEGVWTSGIAVLRAILCVWAVVGTVSALRAPAGAYVAEGRWRKEGWVAVNAVAALALFLAPMGVFAVAAAVAVGVYFADVRPAVSTGSR